MHAVHADMKENTVIWVYFLDLLTSIDNSFGFTGSC